MLDDAGPQEFPGLHDRRVILVLQLDRHGAVGVLIAVANLVQPLIQVQRADHAAFERHVGGFVQTCDFADTVFFFVALAFFLVGFIVGYLHWIPKLPDSRFRQAIDSGLFCVALSLLLDPVLYFSWFTYRKRKGDRNDA